MEKSRVLLGTVRLPNVSQKGVKVYQYFQVKNSIIKVTETISE